MCSQLVSPGGEDAPYNGLYGEAPPVRGTLFRLQVYKKGRDFTRFRYIKG